MKQVTKSLTPHLGHPNFLHSPRSWLLLGLLCMLSGAALCAERPDHGLRQGRDGRFQIPLHKSQIILLRQPPAKVSVGSSEIADIEPMAGRQLYILGKSPGTTNILAWDSNGVLFQTLDVEVIPDLESLKIKLHELLPGERITVQSSQGRLVMGGEVSNMVKMDAALQIASSFLPGCAQGGGAGGADVGGGTGGPTGQQGCGPDAIVNMMQVAGVHQVMLEIKVAEIARDVFKELKPDTNFFFFGNDATFGLSKGGAFVPGDGTAIFDRLIDNSGLLFSYLSGDFLFHAVMDASRKKGLGQILAEPTLTTISGQEANFLSGGEFPIPVPGGATQGTTIQFKEFGVGVKFLPVVLDSGRINLKINVAVSEISQESPVVIEAPSTANAFIVPSLTKRSTSSAVELADGQTIGIAGLLSENTREFVDKFPGVGDVPVLGALFRSQQYQKGQTELVIFVKPHLARPIAPQQVRLPTDSFIPPTDAEFYLGGRMESSKIPGSPGPAPRYSGQAPAPVGQPLATPEAGKFGHGL